MVDALPLPVPPVPPRPRRLITRLFRLSLVALVLLLALTWFAPAIIAKTSLLNTVLARAGSDLRGSLTADSAALSWFGPIDLHGVKLLDAEGQPVLTADMVSSSRSLYELITDRSELGTFTIASPKLEVTVADGTTNVEKVIETYLTDTTPSKPERTPLKLEVTNGTVILREPARKSEETLNAFHLSLSLPRARTEPISLGVSTETRDPAAPGKLQAETEILASGKLKLTANQFPVGVLAPILHRLDPASSAAGKLTADLQMTWQSEEKKPLALTVDGTASASAIRLAGTWLGSETLALDALSAPCKFRYANGVLAVDHSNITCDVGSLEFSGTFDPSADPQALAHQAGLKLKAQLDVAKLAKLMPKLLRVKAGTEIRSGTVALDLSSTAGAEGAVLSGTIITSKLEATGDGKPLVWESPLSLSFAGKLRPDSMPHFDKLEIRSDFLNVNARGELEAFDVAARADLGTLRAKLGEFVELGNWKFNGDATVRVTTTRQPSGSFTIKGSTICNNLSVSDGATLNLAEPNVVVTYTGELQREKEGVLRIQDANVGITAGEDKLAVTLLKPVQNASAMASGEASVTLIGELARWRSRLGRLIGFPPEWDLAGNGTIAGTIQFDAGAYTVAPLGMTLSNAVAKIPNRVNLNEKQLILKTALRYDRKSQWLTFTGTELTSNTIGATAPKIELMPIAGGGYGMTGTAALQTNLDRLQETFLLRSADSKSVLKGRAVGKVNFDAGTANRFGFVADLTVTNFAYGPPNAPDWSEPSVKLRADGVFDTVADALTLKVARVERDGMTVEASGQLAKISTTMAIDVNGTLNYDLQKIEPMLKEFLGKTAQVTGKETRPFKLTGDLAGSQPGAGTNIRALAGNAALGWKSVKAYGFDVGEGELRATLNDGIASMSPVEATFGGGKVKLTPTISLRPGERYLTFAKGKIIDTASLTPAACADAIGYALPAIANAAQADGKFSFDLETSRIPLAAPTTGAMTGRLTIHQANVSPGPVISEVLQMLGVKNTNVNLTTNNIVPIEFKNGRIYHRDFTMSIDGVIVKTAGSVGVDGTVQMELDVPLNGKVADGLLPNNPRLREALSKQMLRIPVAGTLTKPVLDRNAFQGQMAKLIREASKDAAAGAVDDLIKKGIGGFLQKK